MYESLETKLMLAHKIIKRDESQDGIVIGTCKRRNWPVSQSCNGLGYFYTWKKKKALDGSWLGDLE
jgi:hypothetical protein